VFLNGFSLKKIFFSSAHLSNGDMKGLNHRCNYLKRQVIFSSPIQVAI
jgi:hypothetical protein